MFLIYIILFLIGLFLAGSALLKNSYSTAFVFITYFIIVAFALDSGILLFLSLVFGFYLMRFIRNMKREERYVYNKGRESARHARVFDRGFQDGYYQDDRYR